jgi:hypothetical protein
MPNIAKARGSTRHITSHRRRTRWETTSSASGRYAEAGSRTRSGRQPPKEISRRRKPATGGSANRGCPLDVTGFIRRCIDCIKRVGNSRRRWTAARSATRTVPSSKRGPSTFAVATASCTAYWATTGDAAVDVPDRFVVVHATTMPFVGTQRVSKTTRLVAQKRGGVFAACLLF